MITNPTPRLLAECALEACLECHVEDKAEVARVARANAWIFDISEDAVEHELSKLPEYIHYEQALQARRR